MPRNTPPSRPKRPAKSRAPKAPKLASVIPFPCPPGTGERLAAAAAPAAQRWFIGTDCSMHRYLVPADCRADWEAYCDIPEDDERSWSVPAYAISFEGETLEFAAPTLNGAPVGQKLTGKAGGAA